MKLQSNPVRTVPFQTNKVQGNKPISIDREIR
jgi:hypothetical protein